MGRRLQAEKGEMDETAVVVGLGAEKPQRAISRWILEVTGAQSPEGTGGVCGSCQTRKQKKTQSTGRSGAPLFTGRMAAW